MGKFVGNYVGRLVQVESRLAEHRDREIKYCEKIKGLEFKTESSDDYIEIIKKKLELIKKEKESLDSKLTGFQTASKDLYSLLESQKLDKNKEGLGYNVVPPPPAQLYSPPKKDLSWTGLPEFKNDTVTDYSRPSPTIESSSDDAQNRNPSVTKTEASHSTISSKPFIKFVKAADRPKACFNCGHFDHLSYDCRLGVKIGTACPKNNNTHKSMPPRAVVHKTVRSPTRTNRSNMNVAQPRRTNFPKTRHSYAKVSAAMYTLVLIEAQHPISNESPLLGVNTPRCDDNSLELMELMVFIYALMVNPTIYVSYIKQFWATTSIKKANNVVKLQALIDKKKVVVTKDVIRHDLHLDDADGVECLPNEEIFAELARMGYKKLPPNAKRTVWNEFSCSMASPVIRLTTSRKFNFSKVGKGFFRVDTPLFASMLVQPQPQAVEGEDDVEVPAAPTSLSPTNTHSPAPQDPIPTPLQAQPATPSPLQEQPTDTSEYSMSLLNTLMETWGKIANIDADKDITLVDMETQGDMDTELQGRIDDTLIKMKAKKARLLDEQMAKSLHDEEVKQAAAREKQEKDDLERAQVLQQYDDKEENIDWNVVAE
nr:hypothetical protein [Tanacetum cinerariifolium]